MASLLVESNPVPSNYHGRKSTTNMLTENKDTNVAAVQNRLNSRNGIYRKGSFFGVSGNCNLLQDRTNSSGRIYAAAGPHVVLMAASNVPSLQLRGKVSPFVIMWAEVNAIDPDGNEIPDMWEWRGPKAIWPTKHCSKPVWMSGRGFDVPVKYQERATLRIEMWNELESKAKLIGAAVVRFKDLKVGQRCGVPLALNLSMYARVINARQPRCTVYFRRVREPSPNRHVFFLRHGESKWNKAQSQLDIYGMWSTMDHPLNDTGRDQAAGLRDKIIDYIENHRHEDDSVALPISLRNNNLNAEQIKHNLSNTKVGQTGPAGELSKSYMSSHVDDMKHHESAKSQEDERELIEIFLSASKVWASPLTRATCTALVALEPILCAPSPIPVPMRLLLTPNAREKRNFGGKDSSGCAIGEADINKHIRSAMDDLFQSVLPEQQTRLDRLSKVTLDTLQCGDKWWSSFKESNEDLNQRIDELFAQIRYSEIDDPIIVVGHSFYIRQVVRKLTGDNLKRDSMIARCLSKHKVGNAGLLHCRIDFTKGDNNGQGVIEDLHLMFGSDIEHSSKSVTSKHENRAAAVYEDENAEDTDDDEI